MFLMSFGASFFSICVFLKKGVGVSLDPYQSALGFWNSLVWNFQFDKLDFFFLVWTACVACKNPVQTWKKIQFRVSLEFLWGFFGVCFGVPVSHLLKHLSSFHIHVLTSNLMMTFPYSILFNSSFSFFDSILFPRYIFLTTNWICKAATFFLSQVVLPRKIYSHFLAHHLEIFHAA